MKTGVLFSTLALLSSIVSLVAAQEEAPPPPAGAVEPAPAPAPPPPPPLAAPPPAAAPAAVAAPPPPADAGGARTHDGFFLRMGLNGGPLVLSADVTPEIKYSGLHSGFDLLIGGSPVKGLAIGGALIAGRTVDPKVEQGSLSGELKGSLLFAGIGLFADFYLNPNQGLHFQGMLGFAAVDFVSDSGQSGSNNPSGTMFGLGVGYDFWVSDEWSIGPFGRVLYSSLSVEAGGATAKYTYLYPSIGLAFTYH